MESTVKRNIDGIDDAARWIKKNVPSPFLSQLSHGSLHPSDFWDSLRDLLPIEKEFDYFVLAVIRMNPEKLPNVINSPSPIDINRRMGEERQNWLHFLSASLAAAHAKKKEAASPNSRHTRLRTRSEVLEDELAMKAMGDALERMVEFWNGLIEGDGAKDGQGRTPLDFLQGLAERDRLVNARKRALDARQGLPVTSPPGPAVNPPPSQPPSNVDLSMLIKKKSSSPAVAAATVALASFDPMNLPANSVQVKVADSSQNVTAALGQLGERAQDGGADGQVLGRVASSGAQELTLVVRGKPWNAGASKALHMAWMAGVARYLADLHDQKLVHGDVSPRTLLTSSDGQRGVLVCLYPLPAGTDAQKWSFLPNDDWVIFRKSDGPVTAEDETRYFALLLWWVINKTTPFKGETNLVIRNKLKAGNWPEPDIPEGYDPRIKDIFAKVWKQNPPMTLRAVAGELEKIK